MRNKYPGFCYYCGEFVDKGQGHFEIHRGVWKVIHAEYVFKQRYEKKLTRNGKRSKLNPNKTFFR